MVQDSKNDMQNETITPTAKKPIYPIPDAILKSLDSLITANKTPVSKQLIDPNNGDSGKSGSDTTDLIFDPDIDGEGELLRVAEHEISTENAHRTHGKLGPRQPDDPPEADGPGIQFESQPKLADQPQGVAPKLSNNVTANLDAQNFDNLKQLVENSEVSPQLQQQLMNQLNPEARAELFNKLNAKKTFTPPTNTLG